MAPLEGKVAIVTGASRGIGRAIAERLGEDGASVVVNYAKSAEKAREVVSAVEAAGGQAVAVRADVSRVDEIRRLFEETIERFGRLDVLVNNAGGSIGFKPVAEVTEEEYDRVFALNARGPFFALQEAARRMEDGGRIVNVSSVGTAVAAPNTAAYVGSKGALEQFTRSLAAELGGRGITVNTVSSGATDTEGFNEQAPPEMKQGAAEASPLGRLGRPRDVADVVAFVVGEEARWITGQNLRATGGIG